MFFFAEQGLRALPLPAVARALKFAEEDVRALPAREIARSGSEILACGSSEIIHCVDSEITAVSAVVKKNRSPEGAGIIAGGKPATRVQPRGKTINERAPTGATER